MSGIPGLYGTTACIRCGLIEEPHLQMAMAHPFDPGERRRGERRGRKRDPTAWRPSPWDAIWAAEATFTWRHLALDDPDKTRRRLKEMR
jgi:hypothetical protein